MLHEYSSQILNFIYELTKQDRYYNYYALSKRIAIENKGRVTPKTIAKWFRFLDSKFVVGNVKLHRLYYYPSFFYEKLGLMQVFIFLENPKIKEVLKFQNYAAYLTELNSFKKVMLVAGLIKPVEIISLKNKLYWLKENKKIGNFNLFSVNKGMHIYSPLHKVIDKRGLFYPELNEEKEIDRQIKNFILYTEKLPQVELIKEIKNNPLIPLVLFAYTKRHWSSIKVWKRLKEIYGNDVWKYVKKRKRISDALGIKRVQQTLNSIYKLNLLQQMKVEYLSLELNGYNFFIYFKLNLKNKNKEKKLKKICMNSIYTHIIPLYQNKNEFFIATLTNNNGFENIFNILENTKIFWLLHKKSLPLMIKSNINYKSLIKKIKLSN